MFRIRHAVLYLQISGWGGQPEHLAQQSEEIYGQDGRDQDKDQDNQCAITWDVMAHWLRRLLSTGGSCVRLPLWPSRRDLGQVLYLQLRVRFGVKLRYSIRAVVGSASEW